MQLKSSVYNFKGWQSITLRQFIELNKSIDKLEGEELMFNLVAILTDNSEDFIKKAIPFADVTTFATKVMATLEQLPSKSIVNEFSDFSGYYLPKYVDRIDGTWWSDATYIQVQAVMTEIERIEIAQDKLNKLDLSGFALMCASLFKKKGDIITDELILSREQMFMDMDMLNVWAAFFLLKKWQRDTLKDLKVYSLVLKMSLRFQSYQTKLSEIWSNVKQGWRSLGFGFRRK